MDFYEVIKRRRSVRKYKPDSISDDILIRICEAFQAAPSWANTQAWELILVTDPKVKERLQSTLSLNNPATKAIMQAPVVVCPLGIVNRSGWYKGEPVTRRGDWMMFDLGIATEHLVLAAAAEGLGTVHVAYFDFDRAGEILDIPPDRTVMELIPLGYPDHDPKPVPRKPLGDFLFKNIYGSK